MHTFLSIDVGTSSTKLTLFDQQGYLVKAMSQSYPVDFPRADWAEQDPMVWWGAVCQLAQAMRITPGDGLSGISVSGQTPLCVPIDVHGNPLRIAILWLDRRSTRQVDWVKEHIGDEICRDISINRLDSYFGGFKWLWYLQEQPDLFERTWKILQANSFIIYKLTEKTVIDPSQAGLCSPCFNMAGQNWDPSILSAMGLSLDVLPDVYPSHHVIGHVTKRASELTGIPSGIPVVCGGGDFACSCLSTGAASEGRAALMLGTAGNLLFPGVENKDPRLLHTIHVTGESLPFGGVMAGGNLNWFTGLFGGPSPCLFAQLEEEASQVPVGSEGLIFLPYLLGERTPIWDPEARGAFIGLTTRHTRGHLYRSVLEGIALAFSQIDHLVFGPTVGQGRQIIAIDGGSRSPLWRSILASVLGSSIIEGGERGGTAVGSVFLAALGTGFASSFQEISSWAKTGDITDPDPWAFDRYNQLYSIYAGIYEKMRDDFHTLSRCS